ncbi:MAG: RluA family pseudouridine synthase [Rickettsiales bacterium]|nr:RluA family pseudouridine synthase [Rickettsiales bacterium]
MAITLNVERHDDNIKLESFVKKHFKYLDKSHFYKLIRTGQIRVNGGRVKANDILNIDDEVRFPPFIYEYKTQSRERESFDDSAIKNTKRKVSEKIIQSKLSVIKNSIIFEDENILAINKPSGLASQGGSKTLVSLDDLVNIADNTTTDGLRKIRLVHRLDKDTSGVMIFAKNLVSARSLTSLFKNKNIQKTYLALCYGIFKNKSGVIKTDIIDGEKKLSAITNYKVLGEYKNLLTLVELRPETGRKHQLRIHLSSIGHAIVGDMQHCTRKSLQELNIALKSASGDENVKMDGLYLHAFKIEWQDADVKKMRSINAPVSEKLLLALDKFFDKKVFDKYV